MRTCNRCHQGKDESEFYKDSSRVDGLAYVCKACANAYAEKYRQENKAEFRKGGRLYKARPGTRHKPESRRRYKETNREKLRESARGYSARHAQKRSDYTRRYNAENRDIYLAAKALQKAIRHKELPPAKECTCADCGKQATHYHHDSYAEQDRLKVVPVCSSCHKKRHMSSKV